MWRKYNDESVSAVTDISQIFEQEPGDRPATPYFLVYVRDELKDELVDPVCRDIKEEPQPEAPDSVMEDAIEDDPVVYDNATAQPVVDGQGTTNPAAPGDWFEADTVKTRHW